MASILGVETLQHTNGTDAITIDSSGNITASGNVITSNRPAFHHSSVTGSASPITGDLTFNTELFDIGGVFDNTVFTAPVTGLYEFSFIGFASDANANIISGAVNLNLQKSTDSGSTYSTVLRSYNRHGSTGYPPLNFSTILKLNSGDKIKLNTSDYIYADSTGHLTRFSGYLIG